MALTDDQVGDTLDYLGRTQPLASQRLTTLPSASAAGGGAVSPPLIPSAPGGTPGSPSDPAGQNVNAPGASPLAVINAAVNLARQGGGAARAFSSSVTDPTRGDTGGVSLSDQVRSLQASGTPIPASPTEMGSGAEALSEGAPLATGAEAGGTTAAEGAQGADAAAQGAGVGGDLLGVAGPALGAAGSLFGAIEAPQAYQKAIHALDAVLFGASPFTEGVTGIIGGVIEGVDALLNALGVFGGGSYIPKRQAAGQEARGDLSSLASQYEGAASSADPTQILTALSTGQGARGAVRSNLTLPPDVAQQLGLPAGQVEWSSVTPDKLPEIVRYFGANPDAIGRLITGSGDVGYLPQAQAQQVADAAAKDAQGLMSFLVQQLNTAPPTQPTQPPAPTEMPPAQPTTPDLGGPESALGFAQNAVGA